MTTQWTKSLPALVISVVAACSSAQTPAPQPAPAPVVVEPAPAPTPAPAPAPAPVQHAEAHISGGHITLEHQILFDTDADHIQEQQSQATLTDLVAVLRENTQLRRVRIEGHTDTRGNAERNQDLSRRRAQAVGDYLHGHGFPTIQFEAVGYGATQPLCRDDNNACHERNRRVEFTIVEPAPAAQ